MPPIEDPDPFEDPDPLEAPNPLEDPTPLEFPDPLAVELDANEVRDATALVLDAASGLEEELVLGRGAEEAPPGPARQPPPATDRNTIEPSATALPTPTLDSHKEKHPRFSNGQAISLGSSANHIER